MPRPRIGWGYLRARCWRGCQSFPLAFRKPRDGYLGLMLLDPEFRGRGLGKTLLAEAEARARERGAGRLYLGVLQANPRGRAFWQRQGFAATGVSRADPETGHVIHRLGKDLLKASQGTQR